MTLDLQDSRELIQKLRDKPRIRYSHIAALTAGICIGVTLLATIRSCETELPFNPLSCSTSKCHSRQAQMVNYFRINGSKSPEDMAYAVLQSKRNSRLLASIAVVESGGNPDKRNTGYKRRHDGSFQVNPRHWGTVPADAAGQALQAERIITELTTDYGVKKALSQYGGDSTDKYQRRVLAELIRVP